MESGLLYYGLIWKGPYQSPSQRLRKMTMSMMSMMMSTEMDLEKSNMRKCVNRRFW